MRRRKKKPHEKNCQAINQQTVCDKALRGAERLLSLNKIEYCSIFLGYSKAVNCKESTVKEQNELQTGIMWLPAVLFQPQCIRRSRHRERERVFTVNIHTHTHSHKNRGSDGKSSIKVQLMISFNFYDSANIQVSLPFGTLAHHSLPHPLSLPLLCRSPPSALAPLPLSLLLLLASLTFYWHFPFTDFTRFLVMICMQLFENST